MMLWKAKKRTIAFNCELSDELRTNAGRIQVLSGFQVPLFGAKTLLGERVYYGWPVGLSNPARTTDPGEVHTKSAFTLYLTV